MSDASSPYGGGAPGQQGGMPPSAPASAPVPTSPAPPAWAVAPSSGPTGQPSASAAPGMATAPIGPAQLSAADAGAALRRSGIGNPLPTFVIGALAYIVALGAALVVIASAILTVLTANTDSLTGGTDLPTDTGTTGSGDGIGGFIALLGIPIQLVSLASFGSYDVEMDLGFFGSMTMAWRGMPLLITVAMVLTGFFAARFAQRRWSSNGPLGAALWSGISGLGVATFAVIAARLTAFSSDGGSTGVSMSMHSAGADMFFGTWALIALPMLAGHLAGWEKPSWWPVVADLAAAPRLVLVHALTFAVPVGILGFVGWMVKMLLDGDGDLVLPALMSLPIWGLTGLAFLPGHGMLVVPVHLTISGDVEELGIPRPDEFLWFFDLPWYTWLPMVLIALVVPLLVALLWHRDREIPAGSLPALVVSWAALPLAYFGGSVVLLALVWTSMSMLVPMSGRIGMDVGLALWMPVVAFFHGLVIEAIARFGAPFVDRYVPRMLVSWFRRSARRRRAAAAQAGASQAGVQAPAQGAVPAAPSAAMPPAPYQPPA